MSNLSPKWNGDSSPVDRFGPSVDMFGSPVDRFGLSVDRFGRGDARYKL